MHMYVESKRGHQGTSGILDLIDLRQGPLAELKANHFSEAGRPASSQDRPVSHPKAGC